MAREGQLILKLGFAFWSETHFRAELRFAVKIADGVVFFAFEIAQGNRFWRLGHVVVGNYLFLMDGFLQRHRIIGSRG